MKLTALNTMGLIRSHFLSASHPSRTPSFRDIRRILSKPAVPAARKHVVRPTQSGATLRSPVSLCYCCQVLAPRGFSYVVNKVCLPSAFYHFHDHRDIGLLVVRALLTYLSITRPTLGPNYMSNALPENAQEVDTTSSPLTLSSPP